MKKQIFGLLLLTCLVSNINAGLLSQIFSNCFEAKTSTFEIGQQIRQEAKNAGWDIGKMKSITVGGIIKTKHAIYPDGDMEVCLKEKDGDLYFIMKSTSDDAEKPEWHFLKSSKKGWL